jgi:hypothetical protein
MLPLLVFPSVLPKHFISLLLLLFLFVGAHLWCYRLLSFQNMLCLLLFCIVLGYLSSIIFHL